MKLSGRHMKKPAFLCLIAVLLLLLPLSCVSQAASAPSGTGKKMDILFLHDTHSHLDSFLTVEDGEAATVGGFPRIMTLINQARTQNPDTLILDAGDFSMGTLVQTIYDSEAAELRMLGALGCQVTTLGNHEFDYRSAGLANALNAAVSSGEPVPSIVLCNIDWETMEAEGLTQEQQLLRDAFDAYGIQDYTIITKGDVRLAVFGVFGVDSLACAPTCALKFRDASQAAAEVVSEIKANEDVDMIVCVSHSGTSEDEKKSEDEILAKNVPEIDLIVSGHTHTALEQPIRHGDTYIVSCGEYAKNLGSLSMEQGQNGRWEMTSYSLLPITPATESHQATQDKIDSFMEIVDSSYLSRFGYNRSQVLARNEITFATASDLYDTQADHNLGNLLSDAFKYAVSNADTGDTHPVDVAIVPSGCVRDTFAPGDITVEDVFNAYSLGIGLDGVAGYPLISIYLTGAELKTGAEIDASVSDLMPSARLYTSGLSYSFNPHRIILNKVTDCYLTDDAGNRTELQDDRLYRIICDLYSGQMLGAVTDVSYGILSIQPKFADGTPIENIEDAIIQTEAGELKAWAAIAEYMDSLPDTDGDGISDIPAVYGTLQGRKVIQDSRNLLHLIKGLNKYAVVIILVVLLILALLITLIFLIVRFLLRLTKRKKTSQN
ncbi:trifunctional nucleotide phosphoesterase protein YfkN [Lachnospiraceae bacterium]|jgi:5'-nucleotidase/UDP-sugar diphosphatase|nr:trifunctional nucleotide phosphoesterase protein YfkN [Lachnospiraceae bacterium]